MQVPTFAFRCDDLHEFYSLCICDTATQLLFYTQSIPNDWNLLPKISAFTMRQGLLCNINIKQAVMGELKNKKLYFFYKLPYRGSINRKMKKPHRKRCCYYVFGGHSCSKNDSIFTEKLVFLKLLNTFL